MLDSGLRRSARPTVGIFCLALISTLGVYGSAHAATVTLEASRDNTIYEEDGNQSNGLGRFVVVGSTRSSSVRRALIAFDLAGSGIPENSTINTVTLTLREATPNDPTGMNRVVSVHRLTRNWGEGTSDAGTRSGAGTTASIGDATWTIRICTSAFIPDNTVCKGASWEQPGAEGDFIPAASASTLVTRAETDFSWSSATMVSDVQGWLDDTFDNQGWLLKDTEDAAGSAKWFASKDVGPLGPRLTIEFTPPTQKRLTVNRSGTGGGSVSSNPAGIDCGADCSESYDNGQIVVLTASESADSEFTGWGACDSPAGRICTVTMTADKTVTADFNSLLLPEPDFVNLIIPILAAIAPRPQNPLIALSPFSVTINASQGGADPPPRTVKVTNAGEDTLGGLTATVTPATAVWLVATLNNTTAPATLTLRATVGSLGLGTQNAVVRVRSPDATNSPQTVSVSLVVTQAPQIEPLGPKVIFIAPFKCQAISPKIFPVRNIGGGTLSGLSTTVTPTFTPWLQAELIGPTAPTTLGLRTIPRNGSLGTQTATVTVTSSDPDVAPESVDVELQIAADCDP